MRRSACAHRIRASTGCSSSTTSRRNGHSIRRRSAAMCTFPRKAFVVVTCSLFLHGAGCGREMGPTRMNFASWSGCAATTPCPIAALVSSIARRAPSWPGAGTSTGAMHWGYFERGGRNDGAAASSSGSRPSGTRSQTSVGRSDPKRLASKTCWRRMTRSHWNAS